MHCWEDIRCDYVASLLQHFRAILKGDRLCVDERVVSFGGKKSGIEQYNKNEPKHRGYEIVVLRGITYKYTPA